MELCCTAFFRTSSCCFCGKMLVTTNCYQWAGLSKGRDLLEKKKKKEKTWTGIIGWTTTLCLFWLSEFGTPRTCKKRKRMKTMDSKKKDTWTWWPMTDWTHRRKTADAQCFGMCGLCVLGQCGLTTRTCAVALWVRGLEKKVVRQVTSCIYFWTELPICVPYHFFSRSVKTEPSCWTWLTLRVMWMPLETHTCMYFFSLSFSL